MMILTPVGSFYRAKICSERFGGQMIRSPDSRSNGPGACFSKVPKRFRTRKAIVKSPTSRLQRCFIHIFLTGTEVPFKQEVSGVYTSPFLGTDDLEMGPESLWSFQEMGPRIGRWFFPRFPTFSKSIILITFNKRNCNSEHG